MERLLKMFESLLPLAGFYPRWFQVLLALVLGLVGVVFAAGLVLYPLALRDKALRETESKIGISVAVIQDDKEEWMRESDTTLTYAVDRVGEGIAISPTMGYLSKLQGRRPNTAYRVHMDPI